MEEDMQRVGAALTRLTPGRRRLIVSIVGVLATVMISWQPLLLGVAAFMAASSPLIWLSLVKSATPFPSSPS